MHSSTPSHSALFLFSTLSLQEVPDPTEVQSTGWPSVRHYLPLMPPPTSAPVAGRWDRHPVNLRVSSGYRQSSISNEMDETDESDASAAETKRGDPSTLPASIAVTLSGTGTVELWRRRTRGGAAILIGSAPLPSGCGVDSPASIELFAGSAQTVGQSVTRVAAPLVVSARVRCGVTTSGLRGRGGVESNNKKGTEHTDSLDVNVTADLGVDFLDAGGFGESVGEVVLAVRALPAAQTDRAARWNGRTAGGMKHVPRNVSRSVVKVGVVRVVNRLEPGIPPGVSALPV